MLANRYPFEQLRDVLLPRARWQPFPTAADRDAWAALPERVRQAHVRRGEQALGFAWPALPATLYLEFARNGKRSGYEKPWHDRRQTMCDLVLAECIEGRGRFLDDIANGVWAVCEESSWVFPAHLHLQAAGAGLPDTAEPIPDLFAAETGALLAWTLYLLAPRLDAVSPQLVPRVEREIQQRILSPLFDRTDFWWMGYAGYPVNNWNPWIVSNWLAVALLVERDEERRCRHVAKAMRILDYFVDPYPPDGGCDEGPGYWGRAGASLYDCLEWLYSATHGAVDVYREPLIRNIGAFIYRVHIAGHGFINFADASPRLTPPPGVCFGYGRRIDDPALQALGAWAAVEQDIANRGVGDSLGRCLPLLFMLDELFATAPRPPLPRDVFLPDIQVFAARDRQGDPSGFFVAAKGGHNAESHNHNDVGHFIVYLDGAPLLVDAGVETYTAKTFGPERYTIWTMQSAYHSLPTVNGIQQMPGRGFAARDVAWRADEDGAEFSLDLAGAWPAEAGIRSWKRNVRLERARQVVVEERFELAATPRELTLNLLTAADPEAVEPGVVALKAARLAGGRSSAAATLRYDRSRFDLRIEPIDIGDTHLQATWGNRLTRLVLIARKLEADGEWTLRITR
jgi:hypothetical protein